MRKFKAGDKVRQVAIRPLLSLDGWSLNLVGVVGKIVGPWGDGKEVVVVFDQPYVGTWDCGMFDKPFGRVYYPYELELAKTIKRKVM